MMDDQGFLTFLGRKDDMINCGGYSFFPAEIEAELGEIDGVKKYLVAGIPDPRSICNKFRGHLWFRQTLAISVAGIF